MQNSNHWKESKFIYYKGKLQASKDIKNVSVASRLMTNLIAKFYDENIKIHVRGNLLDLGCGKVPLYSAYKNYITNNICVDWENSLHKNEFLDYTVDLNDTLPFNDSEFDTIILSDVLEHIRYPENLLKEMSRVLKTGGKAIINVPFFYGLHEIPYDYFRYTKYALESMANVAQLNIIKLQASGGVPEILADITSKHLIRLSKIGIIPAKLIQSLTWQFVNTRFGKKISEKSSGNFPFGYFMIVEKII